MPICNHTLYFANGPFDLSEPLSSLLPKMQYILDYWMTQYYGMSVGTLKDIRALDPDTCEIEIERTLTPGACCALGPGFIGEYDESLITELEREYFNLLPGKAPGISPPRS